MTVLRDAPPGSDVHPPRGDSLLAISNGVVQLHAKRYGHGPTKARTLVADDVVVCRMLEPFTRAEKTLLEAGHSEAVTAMRMAFHDAIRDELVHVVQHAIGQRVAAVTAAIHFDPDIVVVTFVLEPGANGAGPSRNGSGPG
jgi:uncharacterized protein YbcI